jgi:hypothetical protein
MSNASASSDTSPPGRLLDVGGHRPHIENPKLVVDAMREVVEAGRRG